MKNPGITLVYCRLLALRRFAASSQYWMLGSTGSRLAVEYQYEIALIWIWLTYSTVWTNEYSLGMNLFVDADFSAASIKFNWDWLVSSETRPMAEMMVWTLCCSSSCVIEGISS
jgi:hypothetical protein